jgi:N-acetylmuramoyl-L-alanine amidase
MIDMAFKIALDAGHGKNTYPPSKGVPQLAEFTFNSAVTRYAKELAEYNGFEVVLTQPLDGNDVPLSERTRIANNAGCDVLVSIHANAGVAEANGYEVFHWHSSAKGKRLAEIWFANAQKYFPHKPRRIWQSTPGQWTNFHMVRETNMPAILLEHAFYTNANDLKLLLSDDFRRLSAEVIVRTICEYFGVPFKAIQKEQPKQEAPKVEEHWALGIANDLQAKGIFSSNKHLELLDQAPTRAEVFAMIHNLIKYLNK